MRVLFMLLVVAGTCVPSDSNAATADYAALPMTAQQRVLGVPLEHKSDTAVEPAMYAAPEPEMTSAPEQLAPPTASDPLVDAALTCPANVTGIDSDCANCWHWSAGVDLGATEAMFSSGAFAISDDETGFSARPYIIWEGAKGNGIRVQGWIFGVDSEAMFATTHERFELELATTIVDVDLFRRLQLQATSILVGAGARGAKTKLTFPNNASERWSGAGLSTFAEFYHADHVTPVSEWGWIGGARLSFLDSDATFLNDNPYPQADHILTIGEGYLGCQYRRHLVASDFVFQTRFERQVWMSNITTDLAFDTTSVRVGFEW